MEKGDLGTHLRSGNGYDPPLFCAVQALAVPTGQARVRSSWTGIRAVGESEADLVGAPPLQWVLWSMRQSDTCCLRTKGASGWDRSPKLYWDRRKKL